MSRSPDLSSGNLDGVRVTVGDRSLKQRRTESVGPRTPRRESGTTSSSHDLPGVNPGGDRRVRCARFRERSGQTFQPRLVSPPHPKPKVIGTQSECLTTFQDLWWEFWDDGSATRPSCEGGGGSYRSVSVRGPKEEEPVHHWSNDTLYVPVPVDDKDIPPPTGVVPGGSP